MGSNKKLSSLAWIKIHVLGWKHWKNPGSRLRDVTSRAILLLAVILMVETVLAARFGLQASLFVSIFLTSFSVVYFVRQIVLLPLSTTKRFHVSAGRLARDTLLSGALVILTFSQFYRATGLSSEASLNAYDYVYFSAVTFSTLGYGDIKPDGSGVRLVAAGQAIIGNVHLAMFVASVFLRMSRRLPPNTLQEHELRIDKFEK